MFDIGWSEILVIAVVAIVVVGPKELPRMLRSFGKTMGTVRRTANDFKRQFDEALREAERGADLEDARKSLQSLGDPIKDIRKSLNGPAIAKPAASGAVGAGVAASATPAGVGAAEAMEFDETLGEETERLPLDDEPPPVADGPTLAREAPPLKTGSADAERGSSAA